MTPEDQIEMHCTRHAAPFVLREKLKSVLHDAIAAEHERAAAWEKKCLLNAATFSDDEKAVIRENEVLREVAEAAEATLILDVAERGGERSIIEDARKIQRLEAAVATWRKAVGKS